MAKLTKTEVVLGVLLLFSIFVTIGLKRKLHLTDFNRIGVKLGLVQKRSPVESIFDLFLIGIGARKP